MLGPRGTLPCTRHLGCEYQKYQKYKWRYFDCLYDSTSNFPRKVSTGKVVKVEDKEMQITFADIKPGNYAVSVLHDENQNKDLDQGKLGIPKEGYGFSNNVMGVMGPPSFRKARFRVPAGKSSITIKMKYRKNK